MSRFRCDVPLGTVGGTVGARVAVELAGLAWLTLMAAVLIDVAPPLDFGSRCISESTFLNSCQLQSQQLPAAIKKGYFIALVARNF